MSGLPLAHALRGLSTLLAYPDAELRAAVPSLREWIDADRRVAAERAGLHALLDAIEGRAARGGVEVTGTGGAGTGGAIGDAIGGAQAADDLDALLAAEGAYVETFDRGRATSLSLFEHVHGDGRDRGQAMVDLLGMYEKAGLAFATSDLPDHLPAYLEFASLQPEDTAVQLLAEVDHILASIGSALARRQSPYAAAFVALLRLSGERRPESRIRPETIEDDTTPAAIDKAWAEEPVTFMGAQLQNGGCGASSTIPKEQSIRIVRRAA